jgi:hypothetical protein
MAFGTTPYQSLLYYNFALAVKAAHLSKKCFDLFNHACPLNLSVSASYTRLRKAELLYG